jgi:hypothetical protein
MLALVFVAAVAVPAAAKPSSATDQMVRLLAFIESHAKMGEAMAELKACAAEGGRVGLAGDRHGASLSCEAGYPAHDPYVYGIHISAAHLGDFNQRFGANMMFACDGLGYGLSAPVSCGAPSHNFTPISAESAAAALRRLAEQGAPGTLPGKP